MGYRIEYIREKQLRGGCWNITRRGALTCLFFLCFLIVVGFFWEEGEAALRRMLNLPGTAALGQAVDLLVQQLDEGEAVKEAFSAFWEQIREVCSGGVY